MNPLDFDNLLAAASDRVERQAPVSTGFNPDRVYAYNIEEEVFLLVRKYGDLYWIGIVATMSEDGDWIPHDKPLPHWHSLPIVEICEHLGLRPSAIRGESKNTDKAEAIFGRASIDITLKGEDEGGNTIHVKTNLINDLLWVTEPSERLLLMAPNGTPGGQSDLDLNCTCSSYCAEWAHASPSPDPN